MTTLRITRSADPVGRPARSQVGSPLGAIERFGNAPALIAGDTVLSYADLSGRVRERVAALGGVRRLVLLECRNDIETVVTYLAALEGRHPVLLAGPDCLRDDLVATYRPGVVARGPLLEVHPDNTHELHADLAVLLSTSGSTGSPKLVRLSPENLRSNARSIATYLALTPDDRAATSLPMHYCYGLSVVNSHLLVGASLLLTDASVVDERFWDDFTMARATSFAGVPHTFDLLDSTGFAERELPTLRIVTQAGGRLDPETVRRYALLGRQHGFDLFVMYGATEATARMAYLPPHLACYRPGTIGVPVPGGTFRIDGGEVGELVYTGDNVMLGYAHGPADLALGRSVHELRTGDLARQHEDGLFELVGRASRIAKLFGVRIDLDRVEELAGSAGAASRAVEYDGRLHLFVTRHRDVAKVRALGQRFGLPAHAVEVEVLHELPVTPSGKPDHGALVRQAEAASRNRQAQPNGPVTAGRIRDLYAQLLGRHDATEDDSFVSLRGDSLSYVEASVRLGRLLSTLPNDWAQLSARELAAKARAPEHAPRLTAAVETSVVLRAVAIVLIVASHANVLTVMGGAHVLLAVVGFNLARLQLTRSSRHERRRSLFRAARNVALPSALWIGGVTLLTGMYDTSTALMLNNLLGSDTWDVRWQFWFLEAAVWALVGVGVVLPLATVDRLERAFPFGFAAGVFAVALAVRYVIAPGEAGPTERYALPVVLWCVALGWMAARARTRRECVITSASAVLACWGFFGDPVREALVAGGVCLLVLAPRMRVPTVALPLLSTLAASSLFVYLTHWQVYPHLETDHPMLATIASFVVGVVVWRVYGEVTARVARAWRSHREPAAQS